MGWISIFIALLLLLVCCAAAADCHGDCGDEECGAVCNHACTHAIVADSYRIGFDIIHHSSSYNHNPSIPQVSPEDVFQPPELAV